MVLTANNAAPSTSQYGACGVFLAHLIDKAITTPAIVSGVVREEGSIPLNRFTILFGIGF